MGVAAFEVRRVDQVRDWLDLIPTHARATHPGVDLQVEGAARRSPRDPGVDARPVAERRRQPMRPVGLEQVGPGRQEHERSEEHTSELQSLAYLVCRLLLEKKKNLIPARRS